MQRDSCVCPLCGNANSCQFCGVDAHKGPCWCANISIPEVLLARIPLEQRNRACICQDCVTRFWQEHADTHAQSIGSDDFYFDQNDLMVFTAAYHLRRGYCCGSGCRHCPYRTVE